MKITIKNIFEKVLFEHTCENNTLLETLKEALKEDIDLKYVNLEDANLRDADLRGANLRGANLRGANLICDDLRGVNLRGADLRGANLICADLRGANLICADLRGANLRGTELIGSDTTNARLPIYSKWDFSIQNDSLNIGCKTKTFSEWKKWFEESEEEFSTERNTEDFKRIQAMFYAYEAYYNFLNK